MKRKRALLVGVFLVAAASVAMSAKDGDRPPAPSAQSRPAGRMAFESPGSGLNRGPAGRRPVPQRNQPGEGDLDPANLGPEEVEQFLVFSREHFPQLHEQLVRARRDNPREFRQMLRRVEPPMRRLMRLWRDDPAEARRVIEVQKLEMRIRGLRQRYQVARDESERTAIREEVRGLLGRRFDLKLARLREEVERLRQRLEEQNRRLNEQDQSRERIVQEEFSRMFESGKNTERSRPGRESP